MQYTMRVRVLYCWRSVVPKLLVIGRSTRLTSNPHLQRGNLPIHIAGRTCYLTGRDRRNQKAKSVEHENHSSRERGSTCLIRKGKKLFHKKIGEKNVN